MPLPPTPSPVPPPSPVLPHPAPGAPVRPAARAERSRWFHTIAAAVLLVLTVAGFHQFYVHGRAHPGRELTPEIRTLVIVHGVGMSLWIVLSLVQPLLIALKRPHVHRRVGWAGAALAATIVVAGWMTGIASARAAPPDLRIWGQTARQFMIVPNLSIVIFACLVAAGVATRRRPHVHRAMMLLATLSAMSAAVSRIDALSALYLGTVWESLFGPFFMTLVVGAGLLALQSALTRSFDRWFAGGLAGLAAASVLMTRGGTSDVWAAVSGFLLD